MNKEEQFKHNHCGRCKSGEVGTKTCFVSRLEYPRNQMLRFVVSPDRVVVFDVSEKLPGHGFWLKADKDVLGQAIEKRIFYKAAKGTVQIPEDLATQVERALMEKGLALLGLCRKAGSLIYGYEGVKKALANQEVAALFEANDSSERGQSKIVHDGDHFPVFSCFNRAELGKVAGLDEVVHVALKSGKLSEQAIQFAQKINLYHQIKQKG